MSNKSGWKLIEEDGQHVLLCRKIPDLDTPEKDMWECAAILIGTRDGNPDVWLRTPPPHPHLIRYTTDKWWKVIKEVPDEEAVAIILRAAKKAPF